MKFIVKTVSALEKVFLDEEPLRTAQGHSAMLNECSSFQAAYTMLREESDVMRAAALPIRVTVDSPIKDAIRVRRVEHVPVRTAHFSQYDGDYLRDAPGLFPDMLSEIPGNGLHVYEGQWDSLWIDIEPEGRFAPGVYPIRISIDLEDMPYLPEGTDTHLGDASYTVELINACLPEQELKHTKWFHSDCLAVQYHCEVFSDTWWDVVEKHMRLMAKRGINMLLTPVHTPPLDTRVGGERLTVQLVDVIEENGKWSFDTEKLSKWIALAKKAGIRYFEIAHFFTQWGAKYAPKIMATVDGVYKRVFGWETDGTGPEYTAFLNKYIPAITDCLKKEGVLENAVFHISDEPHIDHLEGYTKAKNIVKPLVGDCMIIDALSDFGFYQSGALERPVPAVNHIEPFLEAKVPGLWSYYCIGQHYKVPNIFIAMPSYRNRIYAEMLYKYDIDGILQWGWNFYNAQYSDYPINPFLHTDSDGFTLAGDAYQVYPGPDGEPVESIRVMVTKHMLEDLRAFKLLESLAGKEAVMALIEPAGAEPITFSDYPRNAEYILKLREKVNGEIKKYIG